jgi:hypothetical protein
MPFLRGLFLSLLAGILVAAQARPDLSGEWVLAKERSTQTLQGARVTAVTGLLGETVSVRQDAKTLTLDISLAALGRPIRAVYNLDGTESRNMNPGAPGQPDEPIFSRASWDGEKLVILTRGSALVDGKPLETRRVMWIDADGRLTIERTSVGQPTTRSVYERTKQTAPHEPENLRTREPENLRTREPENLRT